MISEKPHMIINIIEKLKDMDLKYVVISNNSLIELKRYIIFNPQYKDILQLVYMSTHFQDHEIELVNSYNDIKSNFKSANAYANKIYKLRVLI